MAAADLKLSNFATAGNMAAVKWHQQAVFHSRVEKNLHTNDSDRAREREREMERKRRQDIYL
jgi:hypothetical protein